MINWGWKVGKVFIDADLRAQFVIGVRFEVWESNICSDLGSYTVFLELGPLTVSFSWDYNKTKET